MNRPDAYFVDLKTTRVRGCTVLRSDGTPVILLNSRCASNQLRNAYSHELDHHRAGDYDLCDAQLVETVAHSRKEASDAES